MNRELLEQLRNFAVATGNLQVAHLITAALNEEQHNGIPWAQLRVERMLIDAFDNVDVTRPDGMTARGGF